MAADRIWNVTAAGDPGLGDIATAWIVCLGSLRDVVDGTVSCPLEADRRTRLQACLGCHHLANLSDERSRETFCFTSDQEKSIPAADGGM